MASPIILKTVVLHDLEVATCTTLNMHHCHKSIVREVQLYTVIISCFGNIMQLTKKTRMMNTGCRISDKCDGQCEARCTVLSYHLSFKNNIAGTQSIVFLSSFLHVQRINFLLLAYSLRYSPFLYGLIVGVDRKP